MLMHSQQKQIIKEKTKNENLQRQLLENMLPTSIVDQLQRQKFTVTSWEQLRALSHRHFGVSIIFAKVENFSAFSSEVAPAQVMEYLNDMFSIFDDLCDQHAVYKVETVGDQYVAAVGIVTGEMLTEDTLSMRGAQPLLSSKSLGGTQGSKGGYSSNNFGETSIREAACSNTAHMISYAQAIIEGSRHVVVPPGIVACPLLRVGIHTGPCISGIVGTRSFKFCLFGDTMNTAARMEQTSAAGCIHVTESCCTGS
jgi:ubiquitin carboxyl-terminal hydrolase 48